MSIVIERSNLLSALNKVSRAVVNNTAQPAHSCILCEYYDNKFFMRAKNTEFEINTMVDCIHEEIRKFVVSGKLIYDIVKKAVSKDIIIVVKDNEIEVKAGKSKYSLKKLDIEFPTQNIQKYDIKATLHTADLINLVKKTAFAVATNSGVKPILEGLHLKAKDSILTATATDRFRVAKAQVKIDDDKDLEVIIPSNSINELTKILNDGTVDLQLNSTHALFSSREMTFETRLISGKYPDIDGVFPTEFICQVELDGHELAQAIDRISVMNYETAPSLIKFSYDYAVDKVVAKLSSTENELGYTVEEFSLKNGSGLISLAISSKYLLDALKAFNSKKIEILFSGNTKPLILQSDDEPTVEQLILPVVIK